MSAAQAAVVTGGAGGIGRAVLARLREDGFRAVSWDLNADVAEADLALVCDVTDEAALAAAAAETVRRTGPIGVLVINAGILGPVAPVWEASAAEIRRVIEVDLVSAFLTARAVVPLMRGNPGPDRGRIVVMSSVQGKEGGDGARRTLRRRQGRPHRLR
jgi:3-oxoacyl-[acyl-carrier protein] reductase